MKICILHCTAHARQSPLCSNDAIMAAASSGVLEVVVDPCESGRDVKSMMLELPGKCDQETPQEGTKEHMNVVEVRPPFVFRFFLLACP